MSVTIHFIFTNAFFPTLSVNQRLSLRRCNGDIRPFGAIIVNRKPNALIEGHLPGYPCNIPLMPKPALFLPFSVFTPVVRELLPFIYFPLGVPRSLYYF
jgi:hypothetical protein